jgi:hypothetical protein
MRRLSLGLLAVFLISVPVNAAWRSEGPFVGAVVDVAVDPAKPSTIYAATHSGGVWRSDDGGQHWMLPGDDMVSRPVEWIEADPATPGTVWAGVDNTGSPGLWRSLDRGKTWKSVRPDAHSYILDQPLAFAPSNPSIIYAPSTNLHYRSADGGKTWESFRVPDQDAYAFAINPKNPKIIYAGGRGSEHNVRRSIDGGKTWKPAGDGLPEASIKHLAIPRERPSTIYASIGFGQLYRSDDDGKTWNSLDLGLTGTEKLFSLDLDPNDPKTLFAATENGLRKSTDGGDTWSTVGGGLGDWYCKGVAFHPQKKGTMYAGTAGMGFFISTDNGDTFTASNSGFAAGWTEKIFAPAGAAGPVFARLNTGLYRLDGPDTWTEIQAPFGRGDKANLDGVLFDRQSPKRMFAHEGSKWWKSEDGGKAWQEMKVPEPGMRDMMKGKLAGPGFKGLVQDAADANTFYAGGSASKDMGGSPVWKSTNGGKKWDAAGTGINGDVTMLRASAPNTLLAAARDGVYRTADGGKSWTLIRQGDLKDLAADGSNVYVATKKGLYRSADNGATWNKVAGIKADEVEAVVISGGKVFAGTFDGVFYSTDGGEKWTAFNDGLMNTDVRALAIGGSRLYAGVAGGSVQSIELP